ncbi:MerR family transcriptional regulator [Kitasatospora sp. NBC_01287]|uniref:MerR family transcriptional regulator n=1 Tax=Kitasatospora sp. NBC_01287 TaxID=2903573 RepID=UPI002252D1E7|nr:MerR family transcriptional regulator [Kitasatospora sp. NBC_01287]MCX4750721.1 MerR family transcriptional regulator [Kitasatospora sp. NBC_01287]
MDRLTIGAFARACGLTPKALRIYDELGLLRPAEVDPLSGYRFYAPEQLERARLVAHLRRIGLPLARIQQVCELTPVQAAAELGAYWDGVLADTAARQDLVTLLLGHLTGSTRMTTTLRLRYAARTDRGLVRAHNEDTAYADGSLLAVADGFGGPQAAGAAVEALKRFPSRHLEPEPTAAGPGELLNALAEAVRAGVDAAPGEAGTTLTALLLAGSRLALVHIGDSRAYLLRDGELFQITHDHTLVQAMVDEGRIAAAEAASHPQRAMLLRALTGPAGEARPDVSLHSARLGDRYLLCSDGLSTVVAQDRLHTALSTIADPDQAVQQLITLANRAGGPDNIACAVADVVAA